MSNQLLNVLYGLGGLFFGVVVHIILQIVSKRKGIKEHRFDERHQYITSHAKAVAWNSTSIAIIVAWALIIVFDGISLPFFLMTGVYVLHNLTYLCSSVYYTNRN
ncbi:DUF2178 domain-containing protein [Paenibacillus azoreducens]|uniref:DUF2178 domain-containing protein n=1 Tax=Paenibacillus azoreducens TaxID=116718 RepID=A0A919YHA4_9BACL|nr:DUF2178 domain-containing protein [Paenibacillus azoreducens]GIO48367.1 hypothetical protein J34TS1_31320 [Paenibacillus azoreducens]